MEIIRFSDGRTNEIENVEQDDPQDFHDWTYKNGRWKDRRQGGHPHEISGKTYLYPYYTDGVNGYYVWRAFMWCYDKAVTLCRELNIMLENKEPLIDIINEVDTLRVESNSYPYSYSNEEYSELVRYENLTRKQKLRVKWDELTEAKYR